METINSLKTTYVLVLWSFDPKIDRGPSHVKVNTSVKYHHYCMPKGTGAVLGKRCKSLMSKFDLWPFDPKSAAVLRRSKSTYMWSTIIVYQIEEELWYWNHFFTDGQTDGQTETAIVKPVYLHNFGGGGIQTYFQCGELVEKWPTWRSKFHGGVTFSRPLVQNLMLKFDPGQLLTLKTDPGSHFFRWKMTLGVIFQRVHFLMLHRLLRRLFWIPPCCVFKNRYFIAKTGQFW